MPSVCALLVLALAWPLVHSSLNARWTRVLHKLQVCCRSPRKKCENTYGDLAGRDRTQGILSMSDVASWLRSHHGAAADNACKDAIATLRGSWLSHLDCVTGAAVERLWTLQESCADAFENAPEAQRLPTDSSYREDLLLLAAGDVRGAEAAKFQIEDRQRRRLQQQHA
jgi:hypothetical protein